MDEDNISRQKVNNDENIEPQIGGADFGATIGTNNPTNTTVKPVPETIQVPPAQNNFVQKQNYLEDISEYENNIDKNLPNNQEKIDNTKWQTPLKQVRTYEGDVADLLSKRKTSSSSMAIAENKRVTGENSIGNIEEGNKSGLGKKILFLIISLILISSGVLVVYYFYTKSPLSAKPTVVQVQKITSLISSDSRNIIPIDNASSIDIQYKIQNEVSSSQTPNTIKEIVLTKMVQNIQTRITGPEIVDIMNINAPDVLKRSLDKSWMLGVYANENGEKDVFVVMTNNFFQNAFSGMLQWENIMADDIKQYLLPISTKGIANTQTTASSTENTDTIKSYFTIRGSFEDRIIKNKDVRAFRTTDGNILFLYSFIDNQRLVITTKESTLNEIISRVEKESFVR